MKISGNATETEINNFINNYINELPEEKREQANETVNTIDTIVEKRENNQNISNKDIIFIKDIKEPFKQVLDRRLALHRYDK